jgi:hypothetical protein
MDNTFRRGDPLSELLPPPQSVRVPLDTLISDGPDKMDEEQTKRNTNSDIALNDPSTDDVIDDPSFSYEGYQVVRGEYFAHINEPSITISDYKISFNSACIKKAPSVEYVQVLVNSEKKNLVIRPCGDDVKDSFSWRTAKCKPKQITCRVFFALVVNLMNWNSDYRYKIIGKQIKSQGEYIFVFDLTSTEIYQRQNVCDENGNEKRKTMQRPVYPDDWKDQFGLPVDVHRKALQINIFDGYAVFGIKENKHNPGVLADSPVKGEEV